MGIITVIYLVIFQVGRKEARRNRKQLERTVAVVELAQSVQGEDRECNCRLLEVVVVLANSNILLEEEASRCCNKMILLQLGNSSEVISIGQMNLMDLIIIILIGSHLVVIEMPLQVRLGRVV